MDNAPRPGLSAKIDQFLPYGWAQNIVVSVFIDNAFWYHNWRCHRLSRRSFSLNNRQFSICARCTGLALGAILSPLVALFFSLSAISASLVIGLTAIDGLTQLLGARESTNLLRFVSGLCLPGAALSLLVLWIRS